ncbi:MAG: hypothetical protein J3K34DRAFT_410794 [Monoraphidium minutum]|nr:MAG: hypothetical protein J3K34DRAFT_410794 [Monoraphidium minutum]
MASFAQCTCAPPPPVPMPAGAPGPLLETWPPRPRPAAARPPRRRPTPTPAPRAAATRTAAAPALAARPRRPARQRRPSRGLRPRGPPPLGNPNQPAAPRRTRVTPPPPSAAWDLPFCLTDPTRRGRGLIHTPRPRAARCSTRAAWNPPFLFRRAVGCYSAVGDFDAAAAPCMRASLDRGCV